eukprot:9279158-Lingulodinium_polyedra.AAC.1
MRPLTKGSGGHGTFGSLRAFRGCGRRVGVPGFRGPQPVGLSRSLSVAVWEVATMCGPRSIGCDAFSTFDNVALYV